jgi:chromosome segregation protein
MYLKSIKLAGFKSFVDPTNITIRGNMSAIVGPNGCGKSNVVDAVRWVIGEMSAKQLRGESMTDVIFNGTSQRKPVGKASIELQFDNSDGRMGGEYAKYAEIAVRRELERDGQSSYFLNGVHVRRRDVIDLFLGTGLGPRSYAIIEQGVVSKVVEAKPEELRIFVEEAAGISKYKERRRETETRMRHTQENLDRLNDIREELGKQLNHLKRQSNAAERYKVYKQEERLLSAQIKALQWKALDAQLLEQDQLINQQNLVRDEKQAEASHIETQIEKIRLDIIQADEHRGGVQKNYYALGADIARLEQQIKDAQEQTKQWQSDLQNTESLLEELSNNTFECQAQIDTLTAEVERLQPQASDIEEIAETKEAALTQAEIEMTQWQESWENFQAQASQTASQNQVMHTKVEHYQQQVDNLSRRHQELQSRLQQLQHSELQTEIAPLLSQAKVLNEKLAEAKEKLNLYAESIVEKRKANYAAHEELQQNRRACQLSEARLASLEALQQAALNAGDEASNRWTAEQGLLQHSRLGQKLQVNKGWELAVETVLSGYFDAICVEDMNELIDRLAAAPAGRFTLIEKTSSSTNQTQNTLAAQVNSDWPLQQWLADIYIADSLTEAKQRRAQLQNHQSIITREGVWLGRNWMRVCKQQDEQNSFLLRQQQIQHLQTEIDAQQKTLQQQEATLKENENKLQQLEAERDALHKTYQELSTDTTEIQSNLSAKQTHLTDVEREQRNLQNNFAECERQLAQTKQALAESQTKLAQLTALQQEHAQQRENMIQKRDQCREHLKQCREVATQARKQADELQIRLNANEDQLTLLKQTVARDQRQIEQLQERQQTLTANLSSGDTPVEAYNAELQVQLTKRLAIETELHEAERILEAVNQQQRTLETQRNTISKLLQEIQMQIEELRMQRQTISVRQITTQEQLNEADFDLQKLIAELPAETTAESCTLELEKVMQRLQRLGPINLAAIEEFETTNERKTYLDKQHADLTEALTLLQDAIRKIDKETRTKFRETYDQLNEKFQALFPKIFGGGSATLEMTEDDLLATGIVVRAHPPGKRNVHVHMLSGGEKALTAIALVFALFQLNPAPFCILDEVDAPLDDNNVGRFSRLVKEMSKDVQFLVISHNKVTIEAADYLMGVTMQEPGVSRLVSVDMREAMAMVETAAA